MTLTSATSLHEEKIIEVGAKLQSFKETNDMKEARATVVSTQDKGNLTDIFICY